MCACKGASATLRLMRAKRIKVLSNVFYGSQDKRVKKEDMNEWKPQERDFRSKGILVRFSNLKCGKIEEAI